MVWDEENIKATFHPADKDYGHMKIDEPNTPYEPPLSDDADLNDLPALDLGGAATATPAAAATPSTAPATESEWEDPPHKAAGPAREPTKSDFSSKRKQHYNMKEAMARARQLQEEEEDDED